MAREPIRVEQTNREIINRCLMDATAKGGVAVILSECDLATVIAGMKLVRARFGVCWLDSDERLLAGLEKLQAVAYPKPGGADDGS